MSLENIFVFKYSQTIFYLVSEIYMEKVLQELFERIFWAPILFKWYKIHLDARH